VAARRWERVGRCDLQNGSAREGEA
jgi:hypothetical protein